MAAMKAPPCCSRSRLSLFRTAALALVAVLCVTAASAVMTVRMFPGTFSYHALRYAASFVGLGWCEPLVVPRVTYAFADAEGPGLSWPGDAAFWAAFPCARSAYRVWLPEPPAPDAPPPPPRDCRSLTVTAFFDIGRARWMPPFARSVDEYLANAATVLRTRNAMVIFTSPAIAEGLVAARRAAGLMDRTLVVGMDLHCAPEAWAEAGARAAMCEPSQWVGNVYLGAPERQQPWYNVVMWMKAALVAAAATLPQPELASEWVTWLDLGCHGPMCFAEMRGECVDPARWAPPDRLRIAQVDAISDETLAASPAAFTRAHKVTFAGTIFGTSRANARAAMDLFRDTAMALVGRGVADTDQTVFHFMWVAHPEAFAAYPVFFHDWGNIVREYTGARWKSGQRSATE